MTMPFERRRNLLRGRKTLQLIANDPDTPPGLKAEALAVLAKFPDDRALATCFLECEDGNLDGLIETLAAAHRALQQAMTCDALSVDVRHAALATERHFPKQTELSSETGRMSPRRWIAAYLLSDTTVDELCAEWRRLGIEDTEAASARLTAMPQCPCE